MIRPLLRTCLGLLAGGLALLLLPGIGHHQRRGLASWSTTIRLWGALTEHISHAAFHDVFFGSFHFLRRGSSLGGLHLLFLLLFFTRLLRSLSGLLRRRLL